jgi:hypothetical protein
MLEFKIYSDDMSKSYTIRSYPEDNLLCRLWIKTETCEGMPITQEDLFKWIDKGYKEKF